MKINSILNNLLKNEKYNYIYDKYMIRKDLNEYKSKLDIYIIKSSIKYNNININEFLYNEDNTKINILKKDQNNPKYKLFYSDFIRYLEKKIETNKNDRALSELSELKNEFIRLYNNEFEIKNYKNNYIDLLLSLIDKSYDDISYIDRIILINMLFSLCFNTEVFKKIILENVYKLTIGK